MTMTIDLGNALENGPGLLSLPPMTDGEFYEFCRRNPDLRVERDAKGNLVLMSPSDAWTEFRSTDLLMDLAIWNKGLAQLGFVGGSSAGYTLPNGSIRSPDISWVSYERWISVPLALRRPFPHVSPDFAVEIMSPSDRLADAQKKMDEYAENGVRLGWLIDRSHRTAYIYRPGLIVEVVRSADELSADPELPGFVADLRSVFAEDSEGA